MAGVLLRRHPVVPGEIPMADPHAFLESFVQKNVEATSHRDRAEARRLAYECRKAADKAGLSWFAIVKAAGGDVQGYVLNELTRAADREAARVS